MLNSDLGVAVEEQNGQRPGDAPEPPMGQQADDNKKWLVCLPRAVGEMCRGRSGDGDRIGGERVGCALGMQRPEFIKVV